MTMSDYFLLFIIIFSNYIIYRKISILNDLFIARILNDTKNIMNDILREEMTDIDNKTKAEKGLWSYFRDKLDDIYSRYEEVRVKINKIFDIQFEKDLLGNTNFDLCKYYDGYPKNFINEVEIINKKCFNQFKENITRDLFRSSKSKDKISALKINIIDTFKRNIRQIIKIYNENRHLITDKEYIDAYPNLYRHTIVIDETQTDSFIYKNTIQIDKSEMKYLISERGVSGMEKVIDILTLVFQKDIEKLNELTMIASQFSIVKKENMIGINDYKKEMTKIVDSLLKLIDTIGHKNNNII